MNSDNPYTLQGAPLSNEATIWTVNIDTENGAMYGTFNHETIDSSGFIAVDEQTSSLFISITPYYFKLIGFPIGQETVYCIMESGSPATI